MHHDNCRNKPFVGFDEAVANAKKTHPHKLVLIFESYDSGFWFVLSTSQFCPTDRKPSAIVYKGEVYK